VPRAHDRGVLRARLLPWGARRAALAAGAGALIVALIVAGETRSGAAPDRPGAALMLALVVVLAAAIVGGPLAGIVLMVEMLALAMYYIATPVHSFAVASVATRLVLAGFVAACAVVSLVVVRLSMARRESDRATARTLHVQQLTAAFSRAATASEVYSVVLAEGRDALGAEAGMVAVRVADPDGVALVATFGISSTEPAGWERFPLSPATPIGDAIQHGIAIFLDRDTPDARYPGAGGGATTASIPLVVGAAQIGALGFRFGVGTMLTGERRAFAITLADNCAQALERARLFDAERRAHAALGLLALIGERLAGAIDPEQALRAVTDLIVPVFSDQCVIELVAEARVRRTIVAQGDPSLLEAARDLERYAPPLDGDSPVAVAIRTATTQVVRHVDALPASAYRDGDHRRAVESIGLASMVVTPLTVRGRTLGAITFGWRTEREIDAHDVDLAAQLARRIALALDNATLYQEAEGERERLAALVRQLPLGVVIAEAPGGRDLFANDRARETLGAGTPSASRLAGVRRALAGESVSADELHVVRQDGSAGVVSISAEPVRSADGAIVGAVATLFDLTEHRRREVTLAFLADASVVLARSLDAEQTVARLAAIAVPRIADRCIVDLTDTAPGRAAASLDHHLDRLLDDLAGLHPLGVAGLLGAETAIATGRPVVELDVAASRAIASDAVAGSLVDELGLRWSIVAPLAARGRTHGVITLIGTRAGRPHDPADVAMAQDLARRIALAVDNSRRFDLEREIAHTLQQDLLPGTLIQPSGLAIAARYRAGGEGTEVGGDFYDAWEIAGGYAVAIGDVEGKGPRAAAMTALTRHAMRVASRYEGAPGDVLHVANEAILDRSTSVEFCTAAIAYLRPRADGWTMVTACAGHVPPLVLRRDGSVEDGGALGTLLGAVASPTFVERRVELEQGDAVVLFTDGVTERRIDGAQFGEERLRALVASLAGESADSIAAHIDDAVVRFAPGLPEDDVAVLVVRLSGSGGPHPAGD
jgi:serine phosphatase RsbU (regulator of sigma subunit)/PAS domain-containing protein